MIRISCPHCGLRDHTEFTFLGDGSVSRPDGDDAAEWSSYLFYRANSRGRNDEFWQHVHGCRSWLVVSRDTATHKIHSVKLAGRETDL